MRLRWSSLLIVLALAGCLFGGGRDNRETIEALNKRKIQVQPSAPLEASSDRAAAGYREFLELSEDDELRAEAMRRLGDIELEAKEAGLADEQNTQQFEGAILMYENLLRTYPQHARNDGVMYQLARAYENNGDAEKALSVLDRLIAEHPQMAQIDEVQFRRGEILFMRKRYAEAEGAYAAVLLVGEQSAFFEQSLYKHGWSQFKQGFHEEGLDSFFVLLDRKLLLLDAQNQISVRIPEDFDRAEREIVDDTLRVVAVSFSYFSDLDAVGDYMSNQSPRPYEYLLYDTLGSQYLEKERFTDAAETFVAFAERNPTHAQAPSLEMRAIDAYKEGNFPTLVLEGKKAFIERYQLTAPFWQENDPQDLPNVVSYVKTNLTDIAQHYHAIAQASGKNADYNEAARWYRTFLSSFPGEPEAARMNFLLAEILFESEQYSAAAKEYERAAYDYAPHADGAEAGYAALLAYREHKTLLEEPEKTRWHRESIVSSLKFANTYPTHPESNAVITKAAEDLFELGEFERAATVAVTILERQPPVSSEQRLVALTVLGHSQFDLGNYPAAEVAYTQALAMTPVNSERHDDLVARLASSVYKQAEMSQMMGDLPGAVGHFRRVSVVAPGSEIAATAEYDAAAALIGLERWGEAAQVLETFRATHPTHQLNEDVNRKLAAAYLQSDQPVKAAGELERIARESTDPQVKEESLWRAAELYDEAGLSRDAAVVYEQYVAAFPIPVEPAIEARQRLADIYKADRNPVEYNRWLNEIVTADATAGAARSERTRYLAAKASLVLAEPEATTYRALRLTVPLEQSLPLKKAQMERALSAYGRAADYGVAEVTTAATYQIAEIYNEFGRALMDSARPPNLNTDELEQYEILLEEQAFPFEEKAIELHEVNVVRLADGVYDEWVKLSLVELAELMPARYAKTEKSENAVASLY